ncbi:protein ANTAGONIST OF LIKE HETEROCHROMATIN PROTEIN 1-like [Teleopsis dalmanni]|uniref:protein ANTAGONIST OF LIKE HETEROCHROMATIN PROTEIN 1-like n=1 Tax=Teleopsis dalmanni TaxID=139649 RepID=UPI0018CD85F5|nr:protein ANTAGONIST OF LIKE HETEROCHROMATIN PROTEIN 1-like [Teleopsis dalmanni]
MNDRDQITVQIGKMFLNILHMYRIRKRMLRRKRRVRSINVDHAINGYYRKTFLPMKAKDDAQFFRHTRMSKQIYALLLKQIAPSVTKPGQQINADERLSLTLSHLAHGDPIQSLALSYKLGKTTVRNIVLEMCDVIWQTLSPRYLRKPTDEQYRHIATDFWQIWNMPNCVGAIDGKHVAIKSPQRSDSQFNSIVLLAACDAMYCFTTASVGAYESESQSDRGIFRVTSFGKNLAEDKLTLPRSIPLPLTSQPFPHYFIADCAFPLKNNLMKPFPGDGDDTNRTQKVFNYRLSRTRRVIENAFGILTARWRVMRTSMEFNPENVEKIVLACLVLHNFVMLNDTQRWYCPQNFTDIEMEDNSVVRGEWYNELIPAGGPLPSVTSFVRRGPDNAYNLRMYLANYFVNEGAIPFQNHIN